MSGRTIHRFTLGVMMLLVSVAALATSHVRIIRLSYVDGTVQMDRANGQGLERAILNAPVVEGSRLITGSDGLAEVEFEDNTGVRLGEATEIRFSQLLINDDGNRVNEVELLRGTMYFDARSSKADIDRVIAAGQSFVMRRDSQVRFQMIGDQVRASVLSGAATLASGGQLVRLRKNDSLTVDAANPAGFTIARNDPDSQPLDHWSNERHAYQDTYAYNNNYDYGGKSLSAYGYSDLAYYGTFMNVPGYGMAWQPFGASSWSGWNPYMSGTWNYLGGMGYVWASAYPWGWMPYHYGSWAYQPGMGWFWYPGNTLNKGGVATNWQPTAPVVKAPSGYTPPTPPVASASGSHPAILVGRIGNSPAYLPDGPVPPNFRSVIQDHSGLVGVNSNAAFGGSTGSSGPSYSSRAVNPGHAGAAQNGHVFTVPPARSMLSEGYAGWGGGEMGHAAHQSVSPMHSSSSGVHASSSAVGHVGATK